MRFLPFLFLFYVSLYSSKDLLAQRSFTLEQCREHSIKNSSLLEQIKIVSAISEAKGDLLRKLITPSAEGFAVMTYQSDTPDPNSALNGGFDFIPISKDQYRTGIYAKQNIYLGGEYITKKELLSNENAIANIKIEEQQIILENSSDDLFFSALLLNESLQILKIHKTILLVDLNVLNDLFKQGKIFSVEVLKIEAAIAELDLKIEELQWDGAKLRSMLSVLIGIEIKVSDTLQTPNIPASCLPENNLLFKRIELESQKNLLSEKLSKASTLPKAYLFGITGFSKPALDIFSNNPDFYGVIGLSVNIPITAWRDHKRYSKVVSLRERQLNLIQENLEKENRLSKTNFEKDIQKYRGVIEKDRLLISKQIDIREQTQILLNAGKTGSSELIKALSQETNIKINMEYHKIELIKASIKRNRVINEKIGLLNEW